MSQARRARPPQVRASLSPEVRKCLWLNGLDHLASGISKPRVGRMSQAKLSGPPRAQHLRARSCEDVSGELGRTTSRSISEPRITKMSQAKPDGPPFARHLGAQSYKDVSGEIGGTTSGQAIFEPRVARMSQARRAGPPQVRASEPRVARMSHAKRAKPLQVRASLSPKLQGCLRRNGRTKSSHGIWEI